MAGLTFFVPGRPFKKERPRFGRGRTYTHPETVAAEKAVRFYWERAAGDAPPLEGALRLDATFVFARPASQTRAERAVSRHLRRPDVDNLLKLVLDAMNPRRATRAVPALRGAWLDDGQVCEVVARKFWADEGLLDEGTYVTVTKLDD